ncbi:MAG: dihydroorotase [Halobacteriovoraceae bacterium]|nr:dihydroorotase [Halobacteriovoraceae bacterium]
MADLLLKNGEIYKDGSLQKKDILVEKGVITRIEDSIDLSEKEVSKILDLSGQQVLPGLIDSQVHFRDPGLTHKEDLETGSMAAALGGVCTFFEMPNTTPPTTDEASIKEKVDKAKKVSYVNFGFFMGATQHNLEELKKASDLEGCCGIKIFLGSSTGSLLLYEREALINVFKNTKGMISCHSENEDMLRENIAIRDKATTAHDHPVWRNVDTALSSTKRLIGLAREAGRKVHVLHITTRYEIDFLRENKDICTVEVLPQHLTLNAPDCYDQLGTYAQMNPPIRTKDHQEGLWAGILDGTVDVMGSDHAPHTREEKDQGYPKSPSGMPGVQTIIPLMLNHVHEGRLKLSRLMELMAERPAELWNLNKGKIEIGKDADFTVVDLKGKFTIKNEDQASKSGWTPFHGKEITGRPTHTIVGGVVVMKDGAIVARAGKPAL